MNNKQNQNHKNYLMLVEFCNFLRQNGDKLFDKDSKLSLRNDQIIVLHEYLQQIIQKGRVNHVAADKYSRRKSSVFNLANTKEFMLLFQSSQLHFIQDFLFKITSLKITSNFLEASSKESIRLNIFGSITYLEIRNIPIMSIYDLENLRKQLETLIVFKSLDKVQNLIQFCGADQSSPLSWPKLSTLNISYNSLTTLDDSLRLATSIEVLDLSHNNLNNCSHFLHNLPKLKRVNLSFNKLDQIPSFGETESNSKLEYLDLSYNNIERLNAPNLSKLGSLKTIDISNNLISTLVELKNLRFLSCLKEINLNRNPVKLNPNCEQTISEILEDIKIRNSFKQSLHATNLSWANFQNYQLKTSNGPKKVLRKVTIDDKNWNNAEDNSNDPKITMKRGVSSLRLKATNILIEQPEAEESDYIFIGKKNESDLDQDKNQISSSFISNHFSSFNIKNELDYYKQMRQKYGTGWLSVLPNEEKDQRPINKIDCLSSEPENEPINQNDQALDPNLKIIESFVVKRTLDLNQIDQLLNNHNGMRIGKKNDNEICILCLGEQYLLEKDETNSEILSQYEYSSLSEIIDMTKIKKFIKEIDPEDKNEIKIKFKDLSSSRMYEFDNRNELIGFIQCISGILLNKFNIDKCDLYFCSWCNEFGKKSAFVLDESNENLSNEEILKFKEKINNCTKCHRTLVNDSEDLEIHETILTPKNSLQGSPNTNPSFFNLDLNKVVNEFKENSLNNDTQSISAYQDETLSLCSSNQDAELIESVTIEERLKYLFSFDQISKQKLEEITNRARKINNNLKLFLIIQVLSEMKKNDTNKDDQDESVLSAYKLKYSFFSVTKLTNECLCIFTNCHLLIFEIKDTEKFQKNIEFDKCMVNVACIDINHIEVIEIAIAQNYLILNVVNNDEIKLVYKLVSNDMYQNQALLNSLLKTINESRKATMLKQIKKRNNVTFKNLEEIVNLVEHVNFGSDTEDNLLFSARLNLFLYIEKLEIIGNNALINGSNYENCSYSMFVYDNQRIFIVEENLSYVSSQNKNEQFLLVDSARINDIVQLKLFKHDETKIEINILDELSNSIHIKWTIKMNKVFQLSQFIFIIKDIWEKIFFVEIPISF